MTLYDDDLDEIPRPGADPVINNTMTAAEQMRASVEIRRNAQIRRIQSAMQRNLQENTFRESLLQRVRGSGANSPAAAHTSTLYVEPEYTPICQNFELIAQYLFVHYQELALDTLHFEIAEHQLYWYVVREGFTSLGYTEWRAFLQHCNFENVLFRYVPLSITISSIHNFISQLDRIPLPTNTHPSHRKTQRRRLAPHQYPKTLFRSQRQLPYFEKTG